MDHIGIDVHKREGQIYVLAEGGEVIEQRIRTEPERFSAVRGTRPRARIVIEASIDSEWVARWSRGSRPRGHRRGPELRASVDESADDMKLVIGRQPSPLRHRSTCRRVHDAYCGALPSRDLGKSDASSVPPVREDIVDQRPMTTT